VCDVQLIIVQWKENLILCVVAELHIFVNYIKIFSVEQKCFYSKFISPATMQIIRTNF
jgi:hypothetical protein